jgi:hypothetical protein
MKTQSEACTKGLASKTVVMQSLVQVINFGVTIEIPHPKITTIVPATAAKKSGEECASDYK